MNNSFKTGYGVDVASNRADDLDKIMLTKATAGKPLSVLDIGCGAGGQAIRLAKVGAIVTAVDIFDFSSEINNLKIQNNLKGDSVTFTQGNILDKVDTLKSKKFDLIILQRMLHYLPHEEAVSLLFKLKEISTGDLYLSVTGLASDIGRNYSHKEVTLSKRFAPLSKIDAEIFSIKNPVCLYSKEEVGTLLTQTGWKIDRLWVSAFGNIKAICSCK